MSSHYDIEMSTDDTLELDTIIQEWTPSSGLVNVNPEDTSNSFNIGGFQTNTTVFDPEDSGLYNIDINGQTLKVNVRDANAIPDSMIDMTLNNTSNTSRKIGVRFNSEVDWSDFGGTIGSNTGGVTNAYIYRVSDGTLMGQKDISSVSTGGSFTIQDVGLSANTDYNFVAGDGGDLFGYDYQASESFPITSSDDDLTAISGAEGSQGSRPEVHVFNQIGNI